MLYNEVTTEGVAWYQVLLLVESRETKCYDVNPPNY